MILFQAGQWSLELRTVLADSKVGDGVDDVAARELASGRTTWPKSLFAVLPAVRPDR